MDIEQFLDRCLLLDIEFSRNGKIFAVGAVFRENNFIRSGHLKPQKTLTELDSFAADAEYVLGHNLLRHDLPLLRTIAPKLRLLEKPVVDTLYLSPLAFPENPYHRLVKDYKLVRDSVNDPVADAQLAANIFRDQWQSFSTMRSRCEAQMSFYHYCCSGNKDYFGLQKVFEALGVTPLNASACYDVFRTLVADCVCRRAFKEVTVRFLPDPKLRIVLSYCTAWLCVAGGNSVIPTWVRHQLPEVPAVLRQLRDVFCGSRNCEYCQQTHDSVSQLQRYFGFPTFRREPKTEDGASLQQKIVEAAIADRPVFAVLPTGGGKSLCFQLPALIRYQRRGVLTIVVSPLQALMKDQVDNLRNKTGAPNAAALFGMLTAPERGEVLNGVSLGDIAVLYISPEQLRNRSFRKTISQREIGCWVFDEAHCLSKWGHDFRPDYLYAARFIKEFCKIQKQPIPPVQCFTATAKQDVKSEILDYFNRELGQKLDVFEGGVKRDNLHFEVQTVTRAEKYSRLHQILRERLPDRGSAIVYCSTRAGTEKIRDFLLKQDWPADAFHAGLDPAAKRHIQENFITGTIRVICATNAFGMGIDKEDVRLVIHADIPGSLENYIQEAGRAGRDRKEAECILLYDEQDIDSQFSLEGLSELSRKDIAQILRGLRRAKRDKQGEVVLTSGELLRDDDLNISFGSENRSANTKVVTAISWLERAGFLLRNENRTQVFQGRPEVANLEEAKQKIDRLNLSNQQKKYWLGILGYLINADIDQGFSADELAEIVPFGEQASNRSNDSDDSLTASQRVIRVLHDMANAGLLKQTMTLSAFVRHSVEKPSRLSLEKICQLEQAMLDALQEEAPNAEQNTWQNLSLRRLNQRLLDGGEQISNPEIIRNLLVSLSQDGQGLAGSRGSIDLRYVGQDQFIVKLQRDWQSLRTTAQRRRAIAQVILDAICRLVPTDAPASANLLVEFSSEDLLEALRNDIHLRSSIKDPLAAMDRALMYLHEQRVITLQKGLAVFRQAMTVHVLKNQNKRKYTAGDYETLSRHYAERVFQIHVINEYARMALEKVGQALSLVVAYFTHDKNEFVKRFFSDRKKMLERATSQQSYQRIVEDLQNPVQIAVTAAPESDNMLILAGPGSGKTRVVVHRCAYLLRVLRVNPHSILLLCFNRNAVTSLRTQLRLLVGNDANRVTVQTYHGLAMRLTGHSLAIAKENNQELDQVLINVIKEATTLLNKKTDIPGMENDELRDRLLGCYRHILVDEYQDIDEDQYGLVSAIAGRTSKDPDVKLSILAVGDDDQNIYQFRGSNTAFIRRFQEDYQAREHYLLENYRSTRHIISAANALIAQNQDRMKQKQDIRINHSREELPDGGRWNQLDPFVAGRMQILQVNDESEQAHAIVLELQRLQRTDSSLQWQDCAVLAREWSILCTVRAFCEKYRIPVSMTLSSKHQPPTFRIRELAEYLQTLKSFSNQLYSGSSLIEHIGDVSKAEKANPWRAQLKRIMEEWKTETGDAQLPANQALDYLYETLSEQRRERKIGHGVFLSTVHSAKGMEFSHVLVADGGWNRSDSHSSKEEDRRLYYVAMTRARESLALLLRNDDSNPFLHSLQGDYLLRKEGIEEHINDLEITPRCYTVLGMQDLNLGFAGFKPAKHPIHATLASLRPGSRLDIRQRDDNILLQYNDCSLAALSKAAYSEWATRLDKIEQIRVLAMVRRYKEDGDISFRDRYKIDSWEVPLVELFYRRN